MTNTLYTFNSEYGTKAFVLKGIRLHINISHLRSQSAMAALSCTYSVQVKVSQCVLQSVVVFPDRDLCLQPRGKSQPVATAAQQNIKCNSWRCSLQHAS